jgi:hypothetical protein
MDLQSLLQNECPVLAKRGQPGRLHDRGTPPPAPKPVGGGAAIAAGRIAAATGVAIAAGRIAAATGAAIAVGRIAAATGAAAAAAGINRGGSKRYPRGTLLSSVQINPAPPATGTANGGETFQPEGASHQAPC